MHKEVHIVSTRVNLLRFFTKVKQFLTESFPISQAHVGSTFAQRFEFSRDRQRALGTWQDDQALAGLIGVTGGQVSEYKSRESAPPAPRTLKLARVMSVDPGWLAFGEASKAPAPDGFELWLSNRGGLRPPKPITQPPQRSASSRDRRPRKIK